MADKKPPPNYNLSSAPDPSVLKALLSQAKDLSPQQKIDMVFAGIEDQGYKLPPTVKATASRSSIVPKETFASESGALSSLDIEGVKHNRSSGDFATRSATLRVKNNDSNERMHLSSRSLTKKASSKDMKLEKEEKKEKKEKKDKKDKKVKGSSSASSVEHSANTSRTASSTNLAATMNDSHSLEVKKKESEKEMFARELEKQKEKELEQQKLEKERAKEKERENEQKRQEREKEKQAISANFAKPTPQKPKEKEREPAKPVKKVVDAAKKEKYYNKREWDASKSTDLERLNSSFKTENAEDPKLLFAPKPDFSFDNFRFVHQIAKLGGVTVPEIVLIGKQGVGKSELLEALIGRPINYVGFNKNGQSKRPMFFHLVSSSENENPSCLIQSQTDKKSVPIEMTALLLEIENLNKTHKTYHPERINVHYEYKHTFNFTIIDTPGLPYDTESDEYSQVEQHIEELLRPSHRLIVVVEEADQEEWDDVDNLRQLVKKFDPQNKRTVCVMNKFRSAVDMFTSPAELSHYLTRFENSQNHYFTTLPTFQERHAVPSQKSFLQLLDSIESRDKRSLHLLGCSAKYDKYIGIKNLRKYIVGWCWKSYHQREIPKLVKLLESRNRKTTEELRKVKQTKNSINLRLLASRYATLYIHTAQGIIQGTSRGNPYVNGETRKEELDDQYFVSKEWEVPDTVPFENTRLYGGQQIERVFSEFKAILLNLKVDDRDADLLPDPEDKKYLFTACELVEKQIELLMMPLVEQLVQRTTFVLSRVPIVVDNVLGSKGSLTKEADKLMIEAHYFNPFASFLKDEFISHVDKFSEQCKIVCMEEFYSAKTVHYDIQLLEIQKEELSEREGLLRFIFDRIRQRILKNCIRKIYNLFLMPFMNADVWNALQTRIAVLEERELDEIFDADTIHEGLQGDIDQLERAIEEIQQQESKLHEIAPKF